MKAISKYLRKATNEQGNLEVTFEIDNYMSKREVEALKKEQEYLLDIAEKKQKRTSQQNKYLFLLLEEIVKTENEGRTNSQMVWDLYVQMIEKAGCKFEYLMGLPAIENELKKTFRAIKIIEYREYENKKLALFKCFYGSSKFNKEEQSNLIETVLDYASNLNINMGYWKELLK